MVKTANFSIILHNLGFWDISETDSLLFFMLELRSTRCSQKLYVLLEDLLLFSKFQNIVSRGERFSLHFFFPRFKNERKENIFELL